MNKFMKYGLLTLILLLILLFSPLKYCTSINEGNPGSCENIEDSKFIKVFLWEYKPENTFIPILNNKFSFDRIWLEKLWIYSKDYRFPKIYEYDKGQCNLIISTGKNSLLKHGLNWRFEGFNSSYANESIGHTIEKEITWKEARDTIEVKIYKRRDNTNIFDDSIGTVKLIKLKY